MPLLSLDSYSVDPAFDDFLGSLALVNDQIGASGLITPTQIYKDTGEGDPRHTFVYPGFVAPSKKKTVNRRVVYPGKKKTVNRPVKPHPLYVKPSPQIESGHWFSLVEMDDRKLNGRLFKCDYAISYLSDNSQTVVFTLDKYSVSVPSSNCRLHD